MITKQPFVADISHWKEVADFKAISPRPFLMITKASEGVAIVDSKFVRFFAGMKEAGMKRGVYHFNRNTFDGAGQARHFLNIISDYITDDDLLILDVEEGSERPADLIAWFDTVRAARPRNRLLLYSRRNILESILLTTTQKAYFKIIPVWVAGYPANPDEYETVPNFYIPDPTRYGPVVLWQYSAHGSITGIDGDTDLNWISDTFYKILGGQTLPPEVLPETEISTMQQGTLKISQLNYRNGYGVTGTSVLGQINIGDKVIGAINPERNWFIVDHLILGGVRFVPAVQAYCSAYSGYYSVIEEYVPPIVSTSHTVKVEIDDVVVWSGTF